MFAHASSVATLRMQRIDTTFIFQNILCSAPALLFHIDGLGHPTSDFSLDSLEGAKIE